MQLNFLISFLLITIIILLLILIFKSFKKNSNSNSYEIEKLTQQLETLFNKTIEQSGYVNSKIDEIGSLTKKMNNAMTSNVSDMGQMGEVILENILQECGMTKNRDYKTQFSDLNEEGQKLRPDLVIYLPQNRNIIIDSKVPLKDWYDFQNTDDDIQKKTSMKNFINAIKYHINSIAKKDYSSLLNIISPDYVFIFMPHELALISAQKFDIQLVNYAQQKKVIIVGPTTLILCLKLVENIWKLDKQNTNAKEIAELAGGMFDQIIKSLNLLDKTQISLEKSLENINLTKNYIQDGKGSLYSKVNKMRDLGANTKQKLNN
jgi:DNA recombination protein RmuC